MTLDAEAEYASMIYVLEREAIVQANGGGGRISVASLMPTKFNGVQLQVGKVLSGLPSAERFLLHLFGELVIGRHRAQLSPAISLDGFLGSAFSYQSPWLLLVVAGIWTSSLARVPRSVKLLATSCSYWSMGQPLDLDPVFFPTADEVRGFLPQGEIPNQRVVDSFLSQARGALFGQ